MRKNSVGAFSKNIVANNVTAGHSNALLAWVQKQDENTDYSFITDMLLTVIVELKNLQSSKLHR